MEFQKSKQTFWKVILKLQMPFWRYLDQRAYILKYFYRIPSISKMIFDGPRVKKKKRTKNGKKSTVFTANLRTYLRCPILLWVLFFCIWITQLFETNRWNSNFYTELLIVLHFCLFSQFHCEHDKFWIPKNSHDHESSFPGN